MTGLPSAARVSHPWEVIRVNSILTRGHFRQARDQGAGVTEERSIRALIVDDDRSVGDILRDLISKEHTVVDVCNDGHEAIEFIDRELVDIVITDLMMPRIGGLEVLRRAKAANADVIVIIITGHGSLETAIEAIREGAYDYIRKPFKLQEMEIVFNNAVEKIDLVRENRQLILELEEAYDRLVAMEQAGEEDRAAHQRGSGKVARLNFFPTDRPGLHLIHESPAGEVRYFEELQNIAALRRDGLLTEKEFNTLKTHLVRALKINE